MHNICCYPQVAPSTSFLLQPLYSAANGWMEFSGETWGRAIHDDYWVRVRCPVYLPDVCPCRECVCMCVCCVRSIVLSIWNMRRSSSSRAMSPQNAAGSQEKDICYDHTWQQLNSHYRMLMSLYMCTLYKVSGLCYLKSQLLMAPTGTKKSILLFLFTQERCAVHCERAALAPPSLLRLRCV